MKITIEAEPKEIAALVLAVQERQDIVCLDEVMASIRESISEMSILRRFELAPGSPFTLDQLESLLKEKNISRNELAMILFTLRIRPGFRPQDFGI